MDIVAGFSGPQFDKWIARMQECAAFLEVGWVPDRYAGAGVLKLKVARTWFCKVPRCPVCMWRRSMQWLARLYQSLDRIEGDHPNAAWLFLTFTVRNVEVERLRPALDDLHVSFGKLTRRREWRTLDAKRSKEFRPFIGWLRTSEVSKGEDGPNMAHPHLHCLALVSSAYFGSKFYIRQKRWRELWADVAGLDYDPSVYVSKVKPKGGKIDPEDPRKGLRAALAETMKYAIKPSDYDPDNAPYLEQLFTQLHGARMVSPGGEFREYLRARKSDDEEMIEGDGDGETEDNPGGFYYSWRIDGSPRYGYDAQRTATAI